MVPNKTILQLILLVLASSLPGTTQTDATEAAPKASFAPRMTEDVILGPGDVVQLSTIRSKELTGNFRIGRSGELSLPFVGPVQAAGKTISALESELNKLSSKYIRDPRIDVFITEVKSRPVTISGAVANPGVHQLNGPVSVFELLQLAGGPKEAGDVVTVVRRTTWGTFEDHRGQLVEGGGAVMLELSLESIMRGWGSDADLRIQPFDVVSVDSKRQRLVYIAGAVSRPGAVVLDTVSAVRATKLLAIAGGLNGEAAGNKALLWRAGPDSKGTPLALKDILKGKAEDITLREGDYIIVPPKSGFLSVLRAVGGVMTPISTGLLVLERL